MEGLFVKLETPSFKEKSGHVPGQEAAIITGLV